MNHHITAFETTLPLTTLTSQTAVECKIGSGGEFSTLLSCIATAIPTGKEVASGELRYSGKILFSVVYLDSDGQIRRTERGAEFNHSISCDMLAPSYTAHLTLSIVKTTIRRENGSVYSTAIVSPKADVFAPTALPYLDETELVAKHDELTVFHRVPVSGTSETEDEFETEYLSDVLTHSEQVLIEKLVVENGSVEVDGCVSLLITAWKEGLCTFERLVPFHTELPYEGMGTNAECQVSLRGTNLSVRSDEEKGKTNILATITIELNATVWEEKKLSAISDAYSLERETILKRERSLFQIPETLVSFNERVTCPCVTNEVIDFSSTVQAITSVRAVSDIDTVTISATAILASKDGEQKRIELSCPVQMHEKNCKALLVCGFKVSQRKEGELEAECTLKGNTQNTFEHTSMRVIEVQEGELFTPPVGSIQVILPVKGETLWELSKRLHRPMDEVSSQNQELSFPLTGNERILLCRQRRK